MSATETLHVAAERAPFVMLPRWLLHAPEVSDGAKLLYCMLHDLVAGREGPTRPVTRGQLGEACGVSVDTVDRRLGELIEVGAVEKQAQFEIHQGQLANVYWVRLSPPAAALRPPVENFGTPGRNGAAPPPQPCGDPGRVGAAPSQEEQEEEPSPPTPRRAGGLDASSGGVGRRTDGANLRALGANPRAETAAARAEQAQLEAARRAAEIDAEVAARRAEAEEATAERTRAEAEATSVSAALDDELLHRLLPRCREGLPGPLACSAAGLTRAAVTWCRAALVEWPGDLAVAVRRSLEGPPPGPDGSASRLPLPPAPPGASPLLDRVRAWIDLQK
jgi:hypothetical protein